MATRLPLTSMSDCQRAVCTTGPAKLSSPLILGNDGTFNWPTALTTTSASRFTCLPLMITDRCQRYVAGSNSAPEIVLSKN